MVKHLRQYHKQGDTGKWEEYRVKVLPEILATWATIMVECRRSGFVNPHIRDDGIVFNQVTATGYCEDTDLCTMCDRECRRREAIETGEDKRARLHNPDYKEDPPCWMVKP
jgi:hypothetical protein